MVHRLEDASRAGSLARYRNRQSVYQFSELGYRAFAAVEDVLQRADPGREPVPARLLRHPRGPAGAGRGDPGADAEQVYRRLSRLDTVLDDMSRRAAQFHLTLGEIMRSTDTSPETFLQYKNALLTHMTDFMAELDRYLPRLAAAVAEAEAAAGTTIRTPCCASPPRPTSGRSSPATKCSTTGAAAGPRCAPGSPTTDAAASATRRSPGRRACAPPPAPPSPPSSRCSARSPRRSGAG